MCQWRKVEESNSDAVTSPGFRDQFGNPLAGTFRTSIGGRGEDRTRVGLHPATG